MFRQVEIGSRVAEGRKAGCWQAQIQRDFARKAFRRSPALCTAKTPQTESLPVRLGVSALTQILKIAGVGNEQYKQIEQRSASEQFEAPADVEAVMACIREDFELRAYFITGNICEGIYAEDCWFKDPTVSFTGLRKWQRNLQLLVPFLEGPSLELRSLSRSPPSADGAPVLQAKWRLRTHLRLPWRPLIDILGSTEFTLNQSNQVVKHVESWEVSGLEAIAQMFRPS